MNRPTKRHFEENVADDTPTRSLYSDVIHMSPPSNLGEEETQKTSHSDDKMDLVPQPPLPLPPSKDAIAASPVMAAPKDQEHCGSTATGTESTSPPLSTDAGALPSSYVPPRRFGSANGARQRRIPVDVQEVMCRETIGYEQSHEFVRLRKLFLHGYFIVVDHDEQAAEMEAQAAAKAHEARVAAASVHLAVGTEELEKMMSTFLGDRNQSVAANNKFSTSSSRAMTPLEHADHLSPERATDEPSRPSRWSAASPFYQPPTDGLEQRAPSRETHQATRDHAQGDQAAVAAAIFSAIPQDFALEFLSSVPAVSIYDIERQRLATAPHNALLPAAAHCPDKSDSPRKLSHRESAAMLASSLADADGEIDEVVFVRGGKKHHHKKSMKKKHQNDGKAQQHMHALVTKDQATSPAKGRSAECATSPPEQQQQPGSLILQDSSPLRRTMTSPGFDTKQYEHSDQRHEPVVLSPLSATSVDETQGNAGIDTRTWNSTVPQNLQSHQGSRPPLAVPVKSSLTTEGTSRSLLATLHTAESLSAEEGLAQQEAMLMYRLEELQLSETRRKAELRSKSSAADILRAVPFQRPNSGESRRDVFDKVVRCLIALEQLERRNLSQTQDQAFDLIEHRHRIECRSHPSPTRGEKLPIVVSPESTTVVAYVENKVGAATTASLPRIDKSPSKQRLPAVLPTASEDAHLQTLMRQLSPEDPQTEALLKKFEGQLALKKEEETQRSLIMMREEITFQRVIHDPVEQLRAQYLANAREARLAAASEKLARYMPVGEIHSGSHHLLQSRQDAYHTVSRELHWMRALNELITLEGEGRAQLEDSEVLDAQRLETSHWTGYNLRGEYDWGRGVFRSSRPRWAAPIVVAAEDQHTSSARRQSPNHHHPTVRPNSSVRYFGALPSRGGTLSLSMPRYSAAASRVASPPPLATMYSTSGGALHPLALRPETPSHSLLLPQSLLRQHAPAALSPQPPSVASPAHTFSAASPFQRHVTASTAGRGAFAPSSASPIRGAAASESLMRLVRLEIQCREELVQQYYRQAPLGILGGGKGVVDSGGSSGRGAATTARKAPPTSTTVHQPATPETPSMNCYPLPPGVDNGLSSMSLLAQTAALYVPMSSTSTAQRMVTPVFGGRLMSTGSYQLESPRVR